LLDSTQGARHAERVKDKSWVTIVFPPKDGDIELRVVRKDCCLGPVVLGKRFTQVVAVVPTNGVI
jgi:hypothetical protein